MKALHNQPKHTKLSYIFTFFHTLPQSLEKRYVLQCDPLLKKLGRWHSSREANSRTEHCTFLLSVRLAQSAIFLSPLPEAENPLLSFYCMQLDTVKYTCIHSNNFIQKYLWSEPKVSLNSKKTRVNFCMKAWKRRLLNRHGQLCRAFVTILKIVIVLYF